MGQTFDKVGGAIQWIDNPLHILIFACVFTGLFGDNGMLRVRFADSVDNHSLGGFINVSYEIIAAFLVSFNRVGRFVVFGNYITRLARCAHGDGQHWMHRYLSLDVKERGENGAEYTSEFGLCLCFMLICANILKTLKNYAAKYTNRAG